MSRTDDFAKAGQALAETKRTSEAQAQCRYDFDIAAEHGYQYAVEKACEWLQENMECWLGDYNLADDELEDNQMHYSAMIEELRKAMED